MTGTAQSAEAWWQANSSPREMALARKIGGYDLTDDERRLLGMVPFVNGQSGKPRSSWLPVDLDPVLVGTAPADEPKLLHRSDEIACLYPAKVHNVAGESESGKTWFALYAVREELWAGYHVLFLDFEDNAGPVVTRLRDALVPGADIAARFHYIRPDAPLDREGSEVIAALFAEHNVTLAVIDGITEAMVLHGLELKDNSDIAKWLALIPKPLASQGAAVLQIDHVAKAVEGRGRFAIGGQHKLAGIDGAAFTMETIKPFGRGMTGMSRILVAKDRPGWIRQHAPGGILGELHVESEPDGGVALDLKAPAVTVGSFRPTFLMESVSRFLEENTEGMSKRAIRTGVTGRNDAVDLAVELLVGEGFVTVERDGSARRHVSAKPYRQPKGGDE